MNAKVPRPVQLSVTLLLMAHAVGLWQMVLLSSTLGVPLWMPYSALALAYSILAGLLVLILRGKRWARTAYTLVAAFAVLSAFGDARDLSALGLVVVSAKILAVVLLYVSPSECWFSRKESASSSSVSWWKGIE